MVAPMHTPDLSVATSAGRGEPVAGWAEGRRPFAVGVLALGAVDDRAWQEGRLAVALTAYQSGYFLLDSIEAGRDPGRDCYPDADALAARTDAQAFVVHGEVDEQWLDEVAGRLRMLVRRVL